MLFAWLDTFGVKQTVVKDREGKAREFLALVTKAYTIPEESHLYYNIQEALKDPENDWGWLNKATYGQLSSSQFKRLLKTFITKLDAGNTKGQYDVLKTGQGTEYLSRRCTELESKNDKLSEEIKRLKHQLNTQADEFKQQYEKARAQDAEKEKRLREELLEEAEQARQRDAVLMKEKEIKIKTELNATIATNQAVSDSTIGALTSKLIQSDASIIALKAESEAAMAALKAEVSELAATLMHRAPAEIASTERMVTITQPQSSIKLGNNRSAFKFSASVTKPSRLVHVFLDFPDDTASFKQSYIAFNEEDGVSLVYVEENGNITPKTLNDYEPLFTHLSLVEPGASKLLTARDIEHLIESQCVQMETKFGSL